MSKLWNEIFFDEPMSAELEVPRADGPMTVEKQELVIGLTAEELAVDEAINCELLGAVSESCDGGREGDGS